MPRKSETSSLLFQTLFPHSLPTHTVQFAAFNTPDHSGEFVDKIVKARCTPSWCAPFRSSRGLYCCSATEDRKILLSFPFPFENRRGMGGWRTLQQLLDSRRDSSRAHV